MRGREVATLASESLRTEVVGHTLIGNVREASLETSRVALDIAQEDLEVVGAQRATLELATMSLRGQDLEALPADADPLGHRGAHRQCERLLGNGIAILEASEANVARMNVAEPAELLGYPVRVGVALADSQ